MDLSKRTKIVCTLGPASHSVEEITALVEAGMNVCRLNFSHGTHEDHAALIKNILATREATGEPLMILQDLQGPKIRVGDLPKEGVQLEKGKQVIFASGEAALPKIGLTYENLYKDVQPGQRLLLDDGLLAVKVLRIDGTDVVCEVLEGGTLTSHKGLNLPDTKTSISSLSEKDKDDAAFGVAQGVDWMALSFVRTAEDVRELRRVIVDVESKTSGVSKTPIKIIVKIEKPEGVANFDEILAEADGVMVARGDLGVEMPVEQVPIIQKEIIHKCLAAAKPVIVATQMLDSMIRNPRPTRAEVSDIENAVIDHTDATMLSGETATGAHPLEAVQAMAASIKAAEGSKYDNMPVEIKPEEVTAEAMTNVASALSRATTAKAVLVATLSGNAARLMSRYRPELPIFAAVPDERVLHQLNVSWGVRPILIPADCTHVDQIAAYAFSTLVERGLLQPNDDVIFVAGEPLGMSGYINLIELRKVPEMVAA
ncbi:MAG: pyruvate kinase [bacterium]|nr:pyruvate kinase [bacterium]